jgi:YihY family inner membrane protein
VSTLLERVERYLRRELWRTDITKEPLWRRLPMHVARCAAMAVERGLAHQLPIRASALTFVTVLSLVPSLAFAFSVAKSLGQDQVRSAVIDPFLEDMFGSEDAARNALPGLESAVGDASVPAPSATGADQAFVPVDPNAPSDLGAVGPPLPSGEFTTGESAEEEPKLRVAIEQVLTIVENTDVKRLGALGFLVIVSAVIRLLGGIEEALNLTWSVERPRRLVRKLADYLAIVVVAPLLAMVATATTAALGTSDSIAIRFLREDLGFGPLIVWLGRVLPIVTMWIVFTLVYLVMPNTKVRLRSALVGGFAAALLWALVQELHVQSQIGVASYNQIYAGFAAFPIFLAWLWLSWLVVLAGAEFGYADQHQHAYRRQALSDAGNQAWFEVAVLRAVARIVDAFQSGRAQPRLLELSDELSVPENRLEDGLAALERGGLLLRAGDAGDDVFALARPPQSVDVHGVLAMLRGAPQLAAARAELGAGAGTESLDAGSLLDRRMREAYEDATLGRGPRRTLAELVPAAAVR